MSFECLNWARLQPITPAGRKFVLFMLADYSDATGWSFVGQARLSADTGQSVRAVRDHLKWLEDHGYIRREMRKSDDGLRDYDGVQLLRGDNSPPAKLAGGSPADSAKTTGRFRRSTIYEPDLLTGIDDESPGGRNSEESGENVTARVAELAGAPLDGAWRDPSEARVWLDAGVDIERDVFATVRLVMDRRGKGGPPASPRYFTKEILAARERRVSQATPASRTVQTGPAFRHWNDHGTPHGLSKVAGERLGLNNGNDE